MIPAIKITRLRDGLVSSHPCLCYLVVLGLQVTVLAMCVMWWGEGCLDLCAIGNKVLVLLWWVGNVVCVGDVQVVCCLGLCAMWCKGCRVMFLWSREWCVVHV